ncbi:hypothetical protein [Acinetobacter albensis]|uniref:Uncharacterized protein n=1 Tax=Acinetobacter albensis TaxID=1673609 RepID=A0A1C4GSJ8_9GAMM|nr:hypothetical protein [Acinetobacter albensis]SCC70843.1 hypothetical protein GA0116959_101187 [Acinetobacter albensis]
MTKKTLEEKIKQVGFWTFGGIFWYLAIAFFLKSNYPIYDYDFNRSIAYDVIKDALTLAAAFLAPVAAFILFSDWRVQHIEKRKEQESEVILSRINILLEKLAQLYVSVCRDENINNEAASLDIVKQEFLITLECIALEKITEKSFGPDSEAKDFYNASKKILKEINQIGKKLKEDEDFFQRYPLLEKNIDRFGDSRESYLSRLKRQRESIESLSLEISNLTELSKGLRVL